VKRSHPNDPAFPVPGNLGYHAEGMSFREYLAGQALAGMMANPNWNSAALVMLGVSDKDAPRVAASVAVAYADALIAKLKE